MKAFNLLLRACGPPAKVLRVGAVDQLLAALAGMDGRGLPRLEVPMSLAATEGAFALAGGWHPFVAAIRDGSGVLARFYGGFQPTSLAELYCLAGADRQLGPRHLPWLPPPRGYRGEMGLGPDHGISLFGPCTDEKVALEKARLTRIVASITARGYLPYRFGDVTGYFLVRQEEFRFVVRGGKHRAAALAALGWTHLPVRLKPGWVPVISLETRREWPLVRSGAIAASQARRVFERYFEWNGTQQHRRIAP